MCKNGIHKKNLSEKEILAILNNSDDCLICDGRNSDSTHDSRDVDIAEEMCGMCETWKGGKIYI